MLLKVQIINNKCFIEIGMGGAVATLFTKEIITLFNIKNTLKIIGKLKFCINSNSFFYSLSLFLIFFKC